MAATASTSTLAGLFKHVYAPEIVNLIPEAAILVKEVSFSDKESKLGYYYHQPVVVGAEKGVTFSQPNQSAPALNSPITMTMQDAQVQAYEIYLRGQMSYNAAREAVEKGPSAFESATRLQIENMVESLTKFTEIACLYGQVGVATVHASTNVDTTHTTLKFTDAQWAPGIWGGMEGMQLDVYQNDNSTIINSNAALVITAINPVLTSGVYTVTVSGNSTDIAALDTYVGGNADKALVFWYGAHGNEMVGLQKILANTSSTLFNVSAGSYSLWAGTQYSPASPYNLTFGGLQAAVARAVGRGLMEDVEILINVNTWANLLNDQAALRMFDSSWAAGEMENGSKKLTFFSQNGTMTIRPHMFVKGGDAFVINFKDLKRIGYMDLPNCFDIPGLPIDDNIFIQLSGNAGYEIRAMTAQQIFCTRPARGVYVSGIVNA